MKSALITGILGQDGAYLAKLLIEKQYKVYGLLRRYTQRSYDNLDYLGITNKVELISGDLTDQSSILHIFKTIKFDEVYNLGAQSFVGTSWDQAIYTTQVNSLGTLYLLEAIRLFQPMAKYYQASTSEMYGNSHDEKGLQTEETPFKPRSPYAISKLYAYWITNNYKESYSMFCVNGILFNHESPLRGTEFVTRKISQGVARIKAGLQQDIVLGNLDSKRDWGHAKDYVEAMWLMMQLDKPENFIISTGINHSVQEFVELAFKHAGITDWKKYVKIDPKFKRPAELFDLRGHNQKALTMLNWKPKYTFETLVKEMVEEDIKRVNAAHEKKV